MLLDQKPLLYIWRPFHRVVFKQVIWPFLERIKVFFFAESRAQFHHMADRLDSLEGESAGSATQLHNIVNRLISLEHILSVHSAAQAQRRFGRAMISYAQNFEDVILERIFRERESGFYVDIGAWDPVKDSVTKHFYDIGWSGINVEPNPWFFNRLVAERPRDQNLNCCISDSREESSMFYLFDRDGISTFDKRVAEHFIAQQFVAEPVRVRTMRLADVMAKAPSEVHFLKIDVEGWELPVLRSNNWKKYRPTVVLVEAVDPCTYQASWETWDPFLQAQGYIFTYFDGLNRFYVRTEDAGLQGLFGVPPNLFDGFETADLVRARREIARLTSEASQLQERVEAMERQMREGTKG